jgi:hypothetical protein
VAGHAVDGFDVPSTESQAAMIFYNIMIKATIQVTSRSTIDKRHKKKLKTLRSFVCDLIHEGEEDVMVELIEMSLSVEKIHTWYKNDGQALSEQGVVMLRLLAIPFIHKHHLTLSHTAAEDARVWMQENALGHAKQVMNRLSIPVNDILQELIWSQPVPPQTTTQAMPVAPAPAMN